MLSCEELNGQYVMLQQRCSNQGEELAQARAEHQRVSMELLETKSKVEQTSYGGEYFNCVVCFDRLMLLDMQQSNKNNR